MKKFIYTLNYLMAILVIAGSVSKSNAQSGWEKVLAEDSPVFFTSIWFVEGEDGDWKTGWVTDYYGDIYKTTDGGETWTVYSQSFSESLSTIHFVNEDIGYLCTYNAGEAEGKILKSTDGGETWTEQISDQSYWFSSIVFKDASNGIVSGNPNMYTNDGGTTWTIASPSGDDNYYYGYADYASGDTYFAVELWNGRVGKSTDNGATWTNIHTEPGLLCNWVSFLDGNHGMTGGADEQIMITHDGGDTWTVETADDGVGDALCFGWFDPDTLWAAGNDIYKSSDGGETWTVDTVIGAGAHRDMFVTPTNVTYVLNDIITSENSVWRKQGIYPLYADFEASDTIICSGSTVDFSDLTYGFNIQSWDWTFTGGTPSSSTDQFPTVTYSTPGIYDVVLTVTDPNKTDTEIKSGYIVVLEIPAQVEMPNGETTLCTGQYYSYETLEVPYAQDYEWELTPSDVGTLDIDGIEASIVVSDDWTGDFTLKVRATNICGDGEWSEILEGTVYISPDEYTLQGGGPLCEGSEGVEITLDGSQTSIEYELFVDDESTGIIVEGTGDPLSFGLVTEAGYYTAFATNDNCEVLMAEQIEVSVLPLPSQPAIPTGPIAVCDEPTSDYTSEGGEGADSYVWMLTPEEAGNITSDGLQATVNWNSEFTGTATVSLAGVNDCGEGEASETLEITIGATIPEIFGADLVCDFSEEVYDVTENEGSTYTWEITGGTITEGQGTYMITVAWDGEGNGTLSVDEENENGCEGSSEVFEVVIDDCTGISEKENKEITIFPNPANESVNVKAQIPISEVSISKITGNYTYTNKFQSNIVHINTSDLMPGIYFLKIRTSGGIIIKKLIIK